MQSIKDLQIIILHFENYPLITQKRADYLLFKQVFDLIKNKDHLTQKGLDKIIALKAVQNNGLSKNLQKEFSNIVPADIPKIINKKIFNPNWLAGFVNGDGSFGIKIQNSITTNSGYIISLQFRIYQHVKDELLFQSFEKYLNCGKVYKHSTKFISFSVFKFSEIVDKIIPFFQKYPLQGIKSKDFTDFCSAADLIKNKSHLTDEGLNKIRVLKEGINTGRKFH